MSELEILEEKVSTGINQIVGKLKESCANFTEKTDGPPPGMLQTLRNEILKEINKSFGFRDSPTKKSQNQIQNVSEEFKTGNWVQSRSTQTENASSAVNCRRSTTKIQSDPENLLSSLNSDVDGFTENTVDHDDSNSSTEVEVLDEIEDFAEKANISASKKLKLKTSLQRKDTQRSDDSVAMDLDSELRNICSQFVVQRHIFDDLDSLHAHDSMHKNPTSEGRSKRKSPNKETQLHLDLDSQSARPSPKNLKQHSEISKQDINVSKITLREKSEGSKHDVQLSKQNPQVQVAKEDPQILSKDSEILKQKLNIPRGQGKVKRHKSLIAGVMRTTPFYLSKKCEECGKLLSNQDKLKDHILTIHRGEGKFKCELCDFTCQFPGKLKRHMTNRHSETKNYVCDLCSKCFKRNDTLQEHRKIHVGETTHECELCLCKFKFAVSLRNHQLERTCVISQSQTPPRKRARLC